MQQTINREMCRILPQSLHARFKGSKIDDSDQRETISGSPTMAPRSRLVSLTRAPARRKYPQFGQDEIFGLQDAFRKLDVDDKGYLDEATVIKAVQTQERQAYDVVRQALKEVELGYRLYYRAPSTISSRPRSSISGYFEPRLFNFRN